MRHVSKFDWAYERLFCWPAARLAGRNCRAETAEIRGARNSPYEVMVSAGAVTKMMPHRQSAFLDGDCYFVAVTAWMMTAYRRRHCGACNPAAVTRSAARRLVRAVPRRRPAGSAAAAPRTGRPGQGSRPAPAPGRTQPTLPAGPPSDRTRSC